MTETDSLFVNPHSADAARSATTLIGIDPGLSGAIVGFATLCPLRLTGMADMPRQLLSGRATVDPHGLRAILAALCAGANPTQIVIERAQAMPRQGATSGFNYGFGCGAIDAIAQLSGAPVAYLTPGDWKSSLGLTGSGRAKNDRTAPQLKERALHYARRLLGATAAEHYLRYRKHDGRAEAALVAYAYARRLDRTLHTGEKPAAPSTPPKP